MLSIAGVAIIFGSVGIVAEAIVAEVASGRREGRRMRDQVEALSDHFILCGYGRVGSTVARELVHAGQRLVVIDVNPTSLDAARAAGLLVVQGDATSDATLQQAGVVKARGLITTIDSDANNVYVTLSARAMNSGLFIVARANADGAEAKLLQAGADRVVSPYTRAGRQIAELATRPRVADFIDAALSHGELAFSMEEVEIAPGGDLDGRTVGDLRDEGMIVLAVVRGTARLRGEPARRSPHRGGRASGRVGHRGTPARASLTRLNVGRGAPPRGDRRRPRGWRGRPTPESTATRPAPRPAARGHAPGISLR